MTSCVNTLQDCLRLDEQDPLRSLRDLFDLPDGLIYLDGNSLGALPRAAPARLAQAITQEWGQGLIRSWNSAGWFDMPRRVGDKIAQLIGARTGEVVAVDRGVFPPPVGVVGGDRGRVRRVSGERERRSRGGDRHRQRGGAGGSKGGGNGVDDDAHSDDAVGGFDMGLHVAVDPPRAKTGERGRAGTTMMP